MGRRLNFFNEAYFESIDTPEKAYFLGILFADGNVYLKRNRVQITLMNEDSYILDKISEAVGSSAKLYNDRGKYLKLILDSKKMMQDLIDLGCIPNKALSLKFPSLQQFVSHFIRGFFDGDGCISIGRKDKVQVNITSTQDFLASVKDILEQNGIKCSKFYRRYKDKENSSGSMFISTKSHKRFRDFIYDDAELFLKRKKEKFYGTGE